MSSGTGVGILDHIGNIGAQLVTGGLVGFGKDGVKAGVTGQAAIDGTKEITGAKAAEDANAMAREQFDQSTKAALQDRTNAQEANKRNQIAASEGATKARGVGTPKSTNATTPVTGDVSDFLGL